MRKRIQCFEIKWVGHRNLQAAPVHPQRCDFVLLGHIQRHESLQAGMGFESVQIDVLHAGADGNRASNLLV